MGGAKTKFVHATVEGGELELDLDERGALVYQDLLDLHGLAIGWNRFGRLWPLILRGYWQGAMRVGDPLYRAAQDMGARLGIAEGRVANPRLERVIYDPYVECIHRNLRGECPEGCEVIERPADGAREDGA